MNESIPTQPIPSTLGNWVLLMAKVIDSYGLNSESLFEENGISLEDIRKNDVRYPTSLMSNIWEIAVIRTQDPYIAIRVAQHFKPSAYSALGLAMTASRTVNDALMRFSQYSSIISDAIEVTLTEDMNNINLTLIPNANSSTHSPIYEISSNMCCLVNMLKEVAGDDLRVKEVHFEQSLPSKFKLEAFFSCPVKFESNCNKIVFHKHDVCINQHNYHCDLVSSLDQWIENQLRRIKDDMTSNKVKKILFSYLAEGTFTQQNIARCLAMSTRKLQRKLNEEGTTYTELLNDFRKNMAIKLILKKVMPLSEVSCTLGFNNQSNFTRAFKRWTGTTPNQYR